VAHYKNQRGSAGEKLVEIYFLKKGINCFAPSAVNSNRDLVIEIDKNFYGVQVKSASKANKDTDRQARRYKFNWRNKGKVRYKQDSCQIFACVCLKTDFIYFMKNTGQTVTNIRTDQYSHEFQEDSFEKLLKDLQITKGI